MKRRNKMSKAFTLAEILITLSIIGVVAALTIPTLIQRTGNEEYVSRLNKVYSTLSQATEAIMTEQGAATVWASSIDNIYDAYKSHLRAAKVCGSIAGCWTYYRKNSAKKLNGDSFSWASVDGNSLIRNLILSDGTTLSFGMACEGKCSGEQWQKMGIDEAYAHVWADINGAKAPNQFGRDVFCFFLKKDNLYPCGVADTSGTYNDTCNVQGSSSGKWGEGCAVRVIAEGDMNY